MLYKSNESLLSCLLNTLITWTNPWMCGNLCSSWRPPPRPSSFTIYRKIIVPEWQTNSQWQMAAHGLRFSATHRFALRAFIMAGQTCLPSVCYWSCRLGSNRWKAKSSSTAVYQRLSQAPRPSVISHTSELKLNWNSQVSEMYDRVLLLPLVSLLSGTYSDSFFALRHKYDILHRTKAHLTPYKPAFLDAVEQH